MRCESVWVLFAQRWHRLNKKGGKNAKQKAHRGRWFQSFFFFGRRASPGCDQPERGTPGAKDFQHLTVFPLIQKEEEK